ncbi:aminopeptidase [Dokdonia pacifica]|uniref:Peptidase family M28 n=1 Tax=Dokdonia pacifica TaxID=1627892 RepID=A0A238W1S1_9FLAO|nr:M28 family peptidase [Dokdonia pacifica]GGG16262.1 aminopeptidase [Dokdonia pacifica]SNR39659.1 Peptidase family M28 [Dokdonia pacifica]
MKKKIPFLVLLIFIGFTSTAQSFNEAKLLEHVKTLSSDTFEGRRTGEKGGLLARAYVIKTFDSLQVAPFGSKYEHKFTFEIQGKEYNAANILGQIKGTDYPDKYIVVSAHYDHVGVKKGEVYNGADDDASGVSALFALAEYLAKNPPKHTIILAAFDAEELGLKGAYYFVDKMKGAHIVANINMDMISRSAKNELYVVGTPHNERLKSIIENFENPTSSKLLIGHDGADKKQNWTNASDHAAFHKEGIPFLYFGNEDHAGYHQPSDDYENITPEFYKNSVHIVISVLVQVDANGL